LKTHSLFWCFSISLIVDLDISIFLLCFCYLGASVGPTEFSLIDSIQSVLLADISE